MPPEEDPVLRIGNVDPEAIDVRQLVPARLIPENRTTALRRIGRADSVTKHYIVLIEFNDLNELPHPSPPILRSWSCARSRIHSPIPSASQTERSSVTRDTMLYGKSRGCPLTSRTFTTFRKVRNWHTKYFSHQCTPDIRAPANAG
jgi:hypothetical protein